MFNRCQLLSLPGPLLLCPTSGLADKNLPPLMPKGDSKHTNPGLHAGTLSLAPSPHHSKNSGQSPCLALSSHFGQA